MLVNKYLNFGYLSLVAVIFGIVISVSFVNAESPLDSINDSTPSYIIPVFTQQELAKGNIEEEELEEYEFYIKGMTCANCEVKVTEALLKCAGVKDAQSDHEDGYTVVEAIPEKIDAVEITSAVEKAGFTVIEE